MVFARAAESLGRSVVLSRWLYRMVRLTAANSVKAEILRLDRGAFKTIKRSDLCRDPAELMENFWRRRSTYANLFAA
jgi:hypothetical protein